MTNLSLRFSARSDIGRVRKNNEDAGFASSDFLVVADGMGGHAAGELASTITVATIVNAALNVSEPEEVLGALSDAVITSGEHIADLVSGDNRLAGMGNTLTALALREERIAIAHVGDSRAYLFRDDELSQLTKDHTFVQSLVDAGQITAEEALTHPRRNLMMRAIDGIHAVDVDLSVREARIGDRYLLCSDGLSGLVSADVIAACLAIEDSTLAVTALVDQALAYGAPDNVTVIVADLIEDEPFHEPVIIGAAADHGVRKRLANITFPDEAIDMPSTGTYVRKTRSLLKSLLIGALFVGTIVAGGFWWLSNQWFVGTYNDTSGKGIVAIYQGIPVGGLNRLIEISTTDVATLPEYERAQVQTTLDANTRLEAQATVDRLQARAAACVADPTTPGCP